MDDIWTEYEKLVYEHLDDINKVIEQSLKAWNKAFGKGGGDEESDNNNNQSSSSSSTGSTGTGTTGASATGNLGNKGKGTGTGNEATGTNIGTGKLTVEVNLGKDLESRIVDESAGKVADVMVRSTKR